MPLQGLNKIDIMKKTIWTVQGPAITRPEANTWPQEEENYITNPSARDFS